MIEQVINRKNMHLAYRQVVWNKDSAGVDGMGVNELKQHIDKDREAIALSIIQARYPLQVILGVSISKGNGKTAFAWYSNGNRQMAATKCCPNHHTIIRV